MTSLEEWREIDRNADEWVFGQYDPDTDRKPTDGGRPFSLREYQEAELAFRNPGELLADPQRKRAGVWARLLLRSGDLRPEHEDLLPYAGGYDRV